ncbi:MAG TPA: hypothetical protein VMD58_06690 [Acidobacteriaceae bacterium]|nr:hypothetical protein [Acidobacteriaceae bacterium]
MASKRAMGSAAHNSEQTRQAEKVRLAVDAIPEMTRFVQGDGRLAAPDDLGG